jgi:glycosyltransferase involved in cell wall biosynthesis
MNQDNPAAPAPIKVLLSCTGVGTANRGIESFFRECFDGLHGTAGLSLTLLKGDGPDTIDEHRVMCIRRNSKAAGIFGKLINRTPYTVEQMTSLLPIAWQIRQRRPDVVLTSDWNMGTRLVRYRNWVGGHYRVIYSNGAPLPPPYPQWDHVQHVTPFEYEIALKAGESVERNSMVPYGINVPDGDPVTDPVVRLELRRKLNLPVDRPIVLSVGWISASLKRMDYLIDEMARLPTPRPYLVMLGSIDQTSVPIIAQATEKLGTENFTARSVPYEQVKDYYPAADLFTLCSLREAFGRVYMEAHMHGLPSVVNDHPVMRFVLGDDATFVDMNQPGALGPALLSQLQQLPAAPVMTARRQAVRDRFSWPVLVPKYMQLFRAAARNASIY